MQHLCAFQQSVDQAALAAINNVQDDVLTRTSATRFLVPEDHKRIYWAAALGANLTRAQVITPSLLVRRMSPEIAPRRRGAEAFALTGTEIFMPKRPLILIGGEELEVDTAEDAAGASQMDALVSLGPEALPAMPDGDIRMVRATGTTTLVARAWTSVTVTPDLSLEAGRYALVGFLPMSAGCIAARALITGQNPRPGMPGAAAAEGAAVDFDPAIINQLMYYNMGEFTHITIPQFQFLSASADTAETVYLYVIRVGNP